MGIRRRILTPAPSPPARAASNFWEARLTGAPPLANLAVRPRQGIEAAWQPAVLRAMGTHHQIVAGGGWKTSTPRNRFTTPSDMNLIDANGVPAFAVEFNTPLDSRELVRSLSIYFADHVNVTHFAVTRSWALSPISRAGPFRLNRARPGPFTPERTVRRATGSDRLEQPVAARRFRLASSSFARAGSSRNILPLVRAAGGPATSISEIRTALAAAYINGSRLPALSPANKAVCSYASADRTRQSHRRSAGLTRINLMSAPSFLSHREASRAFTCSGATPRSYRRHRYRCSGPGVHACLHPRSGA